MKRLAAIVAVLLLLSAAAPVLACMTDSAMSREESSCCRTMHGNCGKMAKTGCCHTEVRTDEHPQFVAEIPSLEMNWVTIERLLPDVLAVENAPTLHLTFPADHSPPGLVIAKITVLRI